MVSRRHLLKLSALGTASFAAPLAYSASNTTMTHNTGNPIGSTSPKDLSDNARNLDLLVSGENSSYLDRKGVQRRSWKGMEAEFSTNQVERESEFRNFLETSGYEVPVEYVEGLEIARPTQTLRLSGELYRAKVSFLPFVTTVWSADSKKFFSVGDAALRQEMADPNQGAGLSAWKISRLTKAIENAGDALNHLEVPLWAFAKKAVGYVEDGDPSTWDWGPAILAADAAIDAVSLNGGCIVAKSGTYGIGSQATIKGFGKTLKGHGGRAVDFNVLPGYLGDMIVFLGSSYCRAQDFNIRGNGGPNQRCLYFPYRTDSGITQQNKINNIQTENCAVGILLENPVHCTVTDVRTTRDCTLFGLHSQFIAGVGAGQGGTNLRLIGGWFQANAETGTSCRVNSNLSFSSIGTQFEHGRFGLLLRACAGATVISPIIEDCGLPMSLQGCTNLTVISPSLDSGTSPDLGIAIQPLIDIDGGKGIKILGITSIDDNKSYIDYLVRFSNVAYGAFPDNVLIDEYQSEGGKGLLGAENVPRLRVVKDGVMTMQGITIKKARLQLPILTAPPSNPAIGEDFNCDGVLWNPVGTRARVTYSGGGVYTLFKAF